MEFFCISTALKPAYARSLFSSKSRLSRKTFKYKTTRMFLIGKKNWETNPWKRSGSDSTCSYQKINIYILSNQFDFHIDQLGYERFHACFIDSCL